MGKLHRNRGLKRKTCRATIEDLSLELLSHIFSFLEKPCGLWTARMVSRAFRDAANGSVSRLKVEGRILLEDATIRLIICKVSPELLLALHKQPSDAEGLNPNRLPRCQFGGRVKLEDACYAPEFLPHIIEAAISLPPSGSITTRPLRTEECTDATCLVPRPVPLEVALAHMPMLRRLWLTGHCRLPPPLSTHLTSVTSLKLGKEDISHDELAAFASIRSIRSLGLETHMKDVDHSAGQVQIVCSGAFSHLRSLSLETVRAHVWCLSALTWLTRLSLTVCGSGEVRLDPLAALTGLQELRISLGHVWAPDDERISASCSFLGALTGLTSLNLDNGGWVLDNTSELLALTALARLRNLSLGPIPSPPSYEDGFELPRELAFLGTATTLQDLECGIEVEYFHWLTTPAYAALQHALARLGSLTCLQLDCVYFDEDTLPCSYVPLELCSCATGLRSLMLESFWNYPDEAPRQGMFSSLQHLQCLNMRYYQDPLQAVSLLNGINPPQLTRLALAVDDVSLTPDVMESILRFTHLRDLELTINTASLCFLLQLCSLPSLTRLKVHKSYDDDSGLSDAAWLVVVEETLAAVQAILKRLRQESGWPPLEL
eukprot:jgi/Botrbrau1/22112/Bobra.0206s0038.1